MKKSRIHVLIVDDDTTQGQALQQAFTRAGYQVTWCNTAVKALTHAQRMEFHCLVVDCMLPKMNGVDLVEEIRQINTATPPKSFLFSGIFRDKKFIKEAVDRTGALNYFIKPFDMAELLRQVEDAFRGEEGHDDPPLLSLYSNDVMSDTELLRLIQTETTIHSVHLPMLYKRLQGTALSGELTLTSGVGDNSSVLFYNGQVFAVRTPDKDSYFGGLAVGYGFVSPDEVIKALNNPSTKLLGQKLIESMSLSPHAIHVILEEQLALRLSQTLQSGVVSLQWTGGKMPPPDYTLHPQRFEELMADWTRSKVDPTWIKANFALWGSYALEGHVHPHINEAKTIDDLLSHEDFVEREDLPYFFRQLLLGNASIGSSRGSARNWTFMENRLSQLLVEYKSANFFQILGVGEKAQSLELNKAFNDLKEYFDPHNLPAGAPSSVMVKASKVFQQIEAAYKTLSEETARTHYVLVQQNRRAQDILENEPVFRAAIYELQSGHAKEAAKRLQSLIEKKVDFKDLKAYRIWAGLKVDKRYSEITLDQVPPEERHSAPYMMAKGIYHRQRGQVVKALECFRTAHILDPRLLISQSELERLRADLERRGHRDLLREVTSVIDNLFGRGRRVS
ncbi:MAG: response regulator [Bdellovibrionales bacterium]|nr:response regulator [Bdellovibrionales bacterium]